MRADCHVTNGKAGAALLVEAFRDPSSHFVATYSPDTRSLEVVREPVDVVLPVAGWYVDGDAWGVVDAAGVRRVQKGSTVTLATSTEWLLAPRAREGRLAWIDTGVVPASVVESSGERWPSERDVAAFAWLGSDRAGLEVEGADTLAGQYERATLRWPEGSATLDGEVAGGVALAIDATHVGLTTSGDGDGIGPAFIRVDRARGGVERVAAPQGRFHDLAAAADGHWILQDVAADRRAQFDAWIDRTND